MSTPNFDPPVQQDSGQGQPQDQHIGQQGQFPYLNKQEGQGQQQTGDQGEPKLNPAWNEVLSLIPDQNLQKLIIPKLQNWDKNYTQGIQKVHSEYEAYKPFLDQKVDPKFMNDAMLVYQALEDDPVKFVQTVMDHYELELEQGQQDGQDGDPDGLDDGGPTQFDIENDPRFQRYAQMTETVAQYAVAQQEQIAMQEAEQQLDQEIEAAKQKHGEFDEDFVVQRMHFFDEDIDTAVAAYQQHVQSIIQNHRSPGSQAPVIMGGGGGTPSQQTSVSGLNGQDRRKLIVDTLARLNASGG